MASVLEHLVIITKNSVGHAEHTHTDSRLWSPRPRLDAQAERKRSWKLVGYKNSMDSPLLIQ